MRPGPLLRLLVVVAVLAAVAALLLHRMPAPPITRTPPVAATPPAAPFSQVVLWRICERVIDGDTILLDGRERVRLIGVDTPETKHPRKPVEYFGREASAFTRRLAEGRRVRLEYDQTRRDRYGRTLAYVYLEDGTFLNAEIIRRGYGHAYTRFPFRHLEEFRAYEREAREGSRGLWGGGA